MMKRLWTLIITSGLIVASCASCSSGLASTPGAHSQPPERENTTPPTAQPAPTITSKFRVDTTAAPQPDGKEQIVKNATPIPTPADPNQMKLVQQAKDDLARRLRIPAGEIELVAFEPVVWPDGSLGCPQPGMAYIQVLVEGLRMRLQANGRLFEYHSGGGRQPFLCENPS